MDWFRLTAHALILAVAACATAEALPRVNALGDNVQLSCVQPVTVSMVCDFRLLDPAPLEAVTAHIGNVALVPPDLSTGDPAFDEFLIYFLVDSSSAIGQPTMTMIGRHIRSLVGASAPYHRFGLGAFASETRELVKPGSSAEPVLDAVTNLRASSHTTELYRSALQVVRSLSVIPADRKALFVFSDGLADDQAYFHEDVVGAARAAGIIIVGFGYAHSEPDSVALQSVRRLSEDTGGMYFTADKNADLPSDYVKNLYHILGNGGGFTFDLSPAVEHGLTGPRSILLQLTLAGGSASASVPVHIPSSLPPTPAVTPVLVKKQDPAPTDGLVKPDNMMLWIAVALLGAMVIVMLIVLVLLLRRNSANGAKTENAVEPEPDESDESDEDPESKASVAYLEPVDDAGVAYEITTPTYRIGRHSSNDLPVPDPSVSRQHAEIRRRGNTFSITDLDSMNGVFVNNKARKHANLSDNDSIELGDVAFKFTLETTRNLATDSTVILTEPPTEFEFDFNLDDDEDEGNEKIA